MDGPAPPTKRRPLRPGDVVFVANGEYPLRGVFLRRLPRALGYAVVRLDGEDAPLNYTFHVRRIMRCLADALNYG